MDLDRQRRLRAVLDTNVLVGSARRRLLLLASLGTYQLIVSLVTQNLRDFPPKMRFAETTIITPDAFVRLLESGM